jgi:ubiquitin-activating enzyme E1
LLRGIDNDGTVYTEEGKRHDLEKGDLVRFCEIIGMEKLNKKVFEVKEIVSPFIFKVDFEG